MTYTEEDFERDAGTVWTVIDCHENFECNGPTAREEMRRIVVDRNRWKAMYGAAHAANLQQQERHKAEAERDALKAENDAYHEVIHEMDDNVERLQAEVERLQGRIERQRELHEWSKDIYIQELKAEVERLKAEASSQATRLAAAEKVAEAAKNYTQLGWRDYRQSLRESLAEWEALR